MAGRMETVVTEITVSLSRADASSRHETGPERSMTRTAGMTSRKSHHFLAFTETDHNVDDDTLHSLRTTIESDVQSQQGRCVEAPVTTPQCRLCIAIERLY